MSIVFILNNNYQCIHRWSNYKLIISLFHDQAYLRSYLKKKKKASINLIFNKYLIKITRNNSVIIFILEIHHRLSIKTFDIISNKIWKKQGQRRGGGGGGWILSLLGRTKSSRRFEKAANDKETPLIQEQDHVHKVPPRREIKFNAASVFFSTGP